MFGQSCATVSTVHSGVGEGVVVGLAVVVVVALAVVVVSAAVVVVVSAAVVVVVGDGVGAGGHVVSTNTSA